MPYLKGFAHKEININFEKCVNDHKYSSETKAAVISSIINNVFISHGAGHLSKPHDELKDQFILKNFGLWNKLIMIEC